MAVSLALVLASALVSAATGTPEAAERTRAIRSAPRMPVLTGRVTIVASRSGYVSAYLPRALSLRQVGAIRFSFSGAGHFVGVALRGIGHFQSVGDPTVYALREGTPADDGGTYEGYGALPRIPYRLYFFSDAPGGVTISIPALHGSSTLRPTGAWSTLITPLRIRRADHRADGITTFGETHELSSDGAAIGYVHVRHRLANLPTASNDHVEFCTYKGGDRSAGARAYAPGCDHTGGGSSFVATGEFESNETPTTGPIAIGLGGNLKSLDPDPRIEAYGLWLSFPPSAR